VWPLPSALNPDRASVRAVALLGTVCIVFELAKVVCELAENAETAGCADVGVLVPSAKAAVAAVPPVILDARGVNAAAAVG
jgi:hypothetical protein